MLTKKRLKIALWVLLGCAAALALAVLLVNVLVTSTAKTHFLTPEQAADLPDADCILVLGCQVRADGTPSDMLQDRLTRGIELYQSGAAPKLLMSGDHGQADYNELATMKRVAEEAAIPSADIFTDHAGFSTYESMYRAKEIFGVKKVLIVTQEYHLYRAVYIARQLGLEAYGVSCDYRSYGGQLNREVREVLARCKDFAGCILQPEPTFLGEAIPISGDAYASDG